jgi:TolB protein
VTALAALGVGVVLLLAAPLRAEDRLQIDVTDPSRRGYQIAVQRFAGDSLLEPRLAEELDEELVRALRFSGLFGPIDPAAFLGPRETASLDVAIQCDNWKGIGADALVQGRLEARRQGERLRAHFRVWDAQRCRKQGRDAWYEGGSETVAWLARRIADEIVYRFTGRRGVAATDIAFVSDRSGNKEIYVMSADGSNQRKVTGNGSINLFPSWSPKGDSLVYTSFRGGSPDLWFISRGARRSGRLLSTSSAKFRGVWAPDDGQIAVVMNQQANTDIYLVGENGRGLRQVTFERSIETSPAWSPDGKRLAFVSDRTGSPQIYVRDLATGKTRRLTYEGGYNASPAWSPTGEWIAYASDRGSGFEIVLIDPDTGYTHVLIRHPRTDETPGWSPDGRKVVFVSNRRGRKEIYSVDLDGRSPRRLTAGSGNCSNPAWSPWGEDGGG